MLKKLISGCFAVLLRPTPRSASEKDLLARGSFQKGSFSTDSRDFRDVRDSTKSPYRVRVWEDKESPTIF